MANLIANPIARRGPLHGFMAPRAIRLRRLRPGGSASLPDHTV